MAATLLHHVCFSKDSFLLPFQYAFGADQQHPL